jgi:hypothetical protein
MPISTIKGINFKSVVPAGFIAGYLMFFIDYWLTGFLGLFGYFPGTSNAWWMLEHHIESIIFALVFAWPLIYHIMPGRAWLKGAIFGFIWAIFVLIISLVAGALGADIFRQMTFSLSMVITGFLVHIFWGFFLGVLYVPLPGETETA